MEILEKVSVLHIHHTQDKDSTKVLPICVQPVYRAGSKRCRAICKKSHQGMDLGNSRAVPRKFALVLRRRSKQHCKDARAFALFGYDGKALSLSTLGLGP